jgi:tRNA (guanine37-N1)-methyltransferase
VITSATAADAGEIFTLQRAAYVAEGRLHDSFDFPPLTDDLSAVERIVATTSCLVARRGARLVGSVFGALQNDGDWFIGRLMVAPDLQGRGLGRRLLAEIEAAAPPEAVRSVLVTGANSADNQAFYVRHGYATVREEIRGSVPIVVMERLRTG